MSPHRARVRVCSTLPCFRWPFALTHVSTVLDSANRILGTVAKLYVDEDSRELRFMENLTTRSGLLGFERKHHLIPAEAVREEGPGSSALGVDQQSVQSAPTYPNQPRRAERGLPAHHPRALRLRLEEAGSSGITPFLGNLVNRSSRPTLKGRTTLETCLSNKFSDNTSGLVRTSSVGNWLTASKRCTEYQGCS
jgi:hypothetical protein